LASREAPDRLRHSHLIETALVKNPLWIAVALVGLAGNVSHSQDQWRTLPPLVSTAWLAKHLRDPGLVVVHAAPQRSDYEAGHVPGARWLPWTAYAVSRGGLTTELPEAASIDSALEAIGVSDSSRIVIAGGPIHTATRLYFTLDYFGLGSRVALLDGGIDAWRGEGRPLEVATPNVEPGSLTLRPHPEKLVEATLLAGGARAERHLAVVDARLPEFFAGTASNNMPRSGRIPGASNLPFTWLTREFGRFRDRAELEGLLRRAGVARGDTVVSYCHVGMQATVVYFVARLLGYEAQVYDGSFEEWSRRNELPVASGRPPDR
jgi:thiosulfate/3-mercaptopyruvate sulfurtransferase